MIRFSNNSIIMPGMSSAHSHAFQRALRGRTQRRETRSGNFWSWRDQMFHLVKRLNPDHIFNISRFAFVELAMSGVTAVGEFHYVHHDIDGKPYANRLELSEVILRAAQEAGIRLTLIRTGYYRAGFGQDLQEGQKRFCDNDVDETLCDIESLSALIRRSSSSVRLGIAAHSIRACKKEQIDELARFAKRQRIPFHMHVSEQRREIDECLAEHGVRPVELLSQNGWLDKHFTAIHATHLNLQEVNMLGESGATACICRTTERDLGDGLPLSSDLLQAGARLCVGVDSHAASDAFEEIRAVELDDRVRHEKRIVAAEAGTLLKIATENGYAAIGMSDVFGQDEVHLDPNDPSVAGANNSYLADAVIFGANARAVRRVVVDGKVIVENGKHVIYDQALEGFAQSIKQIEG
jgi:formimidoylglutamate deiminase